MVSNKIVISICVILLNLGFAGAATLNVGQGQTYTTIQSAIDAANAGDVVTVAEGTYFENPVVKMNDISIIGTNKEKTIIDGKKTGSGIKVDGANNVKISGFTVQNSGGSGQDDAGISLYRANNNFIANTIILFQEMILKQVADMEFLFSHPMIIRFTATISRTINLESMQIRPVQTIFIRIISLTTMARLMTIAA